MRIWKLLTQSAALLVSIPLLASNSYAQDSYRAVAVNANGGWGAAWNHPTRASAEQAAIKRCYRESGSGCRTAGWSRNACIALATTGNGGYGWGWATQRAKASSIALEKCRSYNPNGYCRIQVANCPGD